jgi:hypothetical protein
MAPPTSPTPAPDLHAELRATRRELAAARRALQEHAARRVAVGRPITREDTVRALSTLLQHLLPPALEDLRAERDRLVRDLGHARAQVKTARMRYSGSHSARSPGMIRPAPRWRRTSWRSSPPVVRKLGTEGRIAQQHKGLRTPAQSSQLPLGVTPPARPPPLVRWLS